MTMAVSVFEIRALKHVYEERPVLDVDRLSITGGAITGLVGPNGSGKSTLLRMLGCIERPTEGRILYKGQAIGPFSEAARFQITLLPQEPFLMKRSVFNNVSYGLKLRGAKRGLGERVHQALDLVGLPADRFAGRPWYALSGGEAQRVALAARLVLKPKVLLLDEPTASVDVASAQLIQRAAVQALQEWGTTIVVASHDLQWLYDVCDDVVHLFRGKTLGTRHETIVFGPWEPMDDGRYAKPLAEGGRLVVSMPPHADAAAIVRFALQDDVGPGAGRGAWDYSVRGTIRRLNLERRTDQVIATVMAGDLAFNVPLTQHQLREGRLFPGQTLDAGYRIDHITWI
jgi:tungstate transport system ATP-binding protein